MSAVFPLDDDPRWRQHTATAGQVLFPVPYPFQDNADILVQKIGADGSVTLLREPEHYALTGAGNPAGGSYTLTTPAVAGEKYRSIGDAVGNRTQSVVRAGRYSSAATDSDLDRALIRDLELKRNLGRTFKADFGQTPGRIEILPKGHFHKSDGEGNLVDGGSGADIENAQEYAAEAKSHAEETGLLADKAEAAQIAAESAAGANLANADSRAALVLTNIPGPVNYVRTAGYGVAGDGGGVLYRRSDGYEKNVAKNPRCDDPAVWVGGSVGLGTWAVNNGLEVVVSPPLSTTARILQAISLTEGRKYKLVYTISGLTSGRLRSVSYAGGSGFYPAVPRTQDGTYEEIFSAPAGMTEIAFRVWDANVNVGARIKNVYLLEEATAPASAGAQSADGTWWVPVPESITPLQCGAKGDGIHDDTAAISLCMSLDLPIDWLDDKYRYRITEQITYLPKAIVNWQARGAKIICDAPAPIYRMICIDGLPEGDHVIDGLTLEGRDKAFQGLRVKAGSGSNRSLRVKCNVNNVRRSNTAYSESAAGIYADGAYKVLDYTGSKVDGCRISAGAGVPGIAGAHGIVARAANGRPQRIIANGIHVENVECDDLGYFADQDGCLFWADRNSAPTIQQETALEIDGAFFKNCLGRSVKSQVESAGLNDIRVVRTKGHTASNVGVDLDLQVGGGRISNFSAIYDGANSAPSKAIILGQTDEVAKPCAVGHVDGVEIAMSNGASMESIIQTGLRRGGKASYRAQNITVEGGSVQMIMRLAGSDNAELHASLRGVTAAPTLSFVRATNGPASGSVFIDDIVNTGASPVPAYSRISGIMAMRVSVGFAVGVSYTSSGSDGSLGDIERIGALAPMGAGDTGVLRPVTFALADGEQFLFPQSFLNPRSGILIVTTTSSRNAHGIFAIDTNNIIAMHQAAAGTDFQVGATNEPGSGTYRLWATTEGVRLSNRSGQARTFTCWMIG